jgi:hypothetical protein
LGRLLAYVTGTVLLRNEYLTAGEPDPERSDQGSVTAFGSEGEKATPAEIAHGLGRMVLEDVAATAKPDTILGRHRKLVAKFRLKCRASKRSEYRFDTA